MTATISNDNITILPTQPPTPQQHNITSTLPPPHHILFTHQPPLQITTIITIITITAQHSTAHKTHQHQNPHFQNPSSLPPLLPFPLGTGLVSVRQGSSDEGERRKKKLGRREGGAMYMYIPLVNTPTELLILHPNLPFFPQTPHSKERKSFPLLQYTSNHLISNTKISK